MLRFRQFITEASRNKKVAELQPTTVVSVFHGTDLQTALQFVTSGVDAREEFGRKFPHGTVGQGATFGNIVKQVKTGLFVSLDTRTAEDFGRFLIKFKALGKELQVVFPGSDRASRDSDKEFYPKSFRPNVSFTLLRPLLNPSGRATSESQARFLGTISPRRIEKVYRMGKTMGKIDEIMTPKDFITWAKEKGTKSGGEFIFEPQEKPTPKEFFKRISDRHNLSMEETEKIVKRVLFSDSDGTVRDWIRGLTHGGLGKFHSTFARFIVPKLARHFGIQP